MGPAETELREGLRALRLEVPEKVADDLTKLAEAALAEVRAEPIKIAEFKPAPGMTVVITMPAGSPPEAIQAAAQAAHKHFPENEAIIKTAQVTIEEVEPEDGPDSGTG